MPEEEINTCYRCGSVLELVENEFSDKVIPNKCPKCNNCIGCD